MDFLEKIKKEEGQELSVVPMDSRKARKTK